MLGPGGIEPPRRGSAKTGIPAASLCLVRIAGPGAPAAHDSDECVRERPDRPPRQSGPKVEVGKPFTCLEGLPLWSLQRWVRASLAEKTTRLMPACRTGTWKLSSRPRGLWAALRYEMTWATWMGRSCGTAFSSTTS